MDNYTGYIGTYTKGDSKGIYTFSIDSTTGSITKPKLAAQIENPTYLTINNENSKLYSIMKYTDSNDNLCGGVASFNINKDSTLTYLNSSSHVGKPPCYVSLDLSSNNLFSGNYHEKNIISYNLKTNGEINKINCEVTHKGESHVHFTSLTPDEKYLCAIDLGLDQIFLYNYNEGKISNPIVLKVKDGCGPRHIAFHPNQKFAYVICECSSEIITLSYDLDLGFEIINYISTLPKGFTNTNSTAAIRVTSDGKFLYGSNRGDNSIVVYSICNLTGNLTLVNFYSTFGDGPRDFNFTPNENFIIIANELTNNLTLYKRDSNNGNLQLIQKNISAPSPVSVILV